MCESDRSGPSRGFEHSGFHHMSYHMGDKGGFPLIGDKFPSMEVKTTHGMVKLPDAYS